MAKLILKRHPLAMFGILSPICSTYKRYEGFIDGKSIGEVVATPIGFTSSELLAPDSLKRLKKLGYSEIEIEFDNTEQ